MWAAVTASLLAIAQAGAECPDDIAGRIDLSEIAELTGAPMEQVTELAEAFTELPFDGYAFESSWQAWAWQRDRAENPLERCLFSLVAQEQFGRTWFSELFSAGAPTNMNQPEIQIMARMTSGLDARNREWLRTIVAEHGWFRISDHGEYADTAAWLIVQHANHDVDFQREMLAMLAPLVENGETSPANYAMLTDRIAVNSGEDQTFGSQGRCTGHMQWEARPYTGTFEEMDARRESVGLEHHAAYVSRMSERCAHVAE